MLQLVYASAAKRLLDPLQLRSILETARRNNTRLGVTGILLYHDGSFFQVLEGEESTVRALFARISEDPRHERVVELRSGPVVERSFSAWTMGFVTLDTKLFQALPGRHALSSNGSLEARAGAAVELIGAFRDGQFRRYILA